MMIDVSGRQLQPKYPATRAIEHGFQHQECLSPAPAAAALTPTATAAVTAAAAAADTPDCIRSTEAGSTAPTGLHFHFPYQQQQQHEDLQHLPLQTQLHSHQQQRKAMEQSPLHFPLQWQQQQQQRRWCPRPGQFSSSRCSVMTNPAPAAVTDAAVVAVATGDTMAPTTSSRQPPHQQLYTNPKGSYPQLVSPSRLPPPITSPPSLVPSSLLFPSSQQQQHKHTSPHHHHLHQQQQQHHHPHHHHLHRQHQTAVQKKPQNFLLQPYRFNLTPSPSAAVESSYRERSSGNTIITTTSSNISGSSTCTSSGTCAEGNRVNGSSSSRLPDPLCGNTGQMVAYITDRLWHQELSDSQPLPAPSDTVQLDSLHCNMSASPSTDQMYYSPPNHLTTASTTTGQDAWTINNSLADWNSLNTTVQSMLGLRLGDGPEQKTQQELQRSGANPDNGQSLSVPSLPRPVSGSGLHHLYGRALPSPNGSDGHTTATCIGEDCSDAMSTTNTAALVSRSWSGAGNEGDTFKDTSPGTPPDPPKKKHCRSLSIPSESSGRQQQRHSSGPGSYRTTATTSTTTSDYFISSDLSSGNSLSLLKQIAFTPVTEDSWSRRHHHYRSGRKTPTTTIEASSRKASFSSLPPPSSLSKMSASLSSLTNNNTNVAGINQQQQLPTPLLSFSGVLQRPSLLVSSDGGTTMPSEATWATSSSLFPLQQQQQIASRNMAADSLSSPPPSQQTVQFMSPISFRTPPESPVPRPASVSIVGFHGDSDSDSRAFKPVSDAWLRRGGGGNSGFSSPSSCSSSSSSFPLQQQLQLAHEGGRGLEGGCFLEAPVAIAALTTAAPFASAAAVASSPSSSSPAKGAPAAPTPSSSTAAAAANYSSPLHMLFWSFQKHRSLSLEEQRSLSNTTSPSSFCSSSSPFLSSPSHPQPHHPYSSYHQPTHHLQQQPPPPLQRVPPTQQHHHYQQQQQLQQQTVRAAGSTPSVPAACKTSVSNPSSPRRQRIPRCRSQPCVLHDRKAGVKRRRDYDRPTLDFHKMTQTAYTTVMYQTETNDQSFHTLQQEPRISWYQQFREDRRQWSPPSATVAQQNLALAPTSGAMSMELLRTSCFISSDHTDDPLSEDAEISAATEAGEAAARAAVAAAARAAAATMELSAAPDDGDAFDTPLLYGGRSAASVAGRGDMSAYVSDESNPSFCGCDDDEDEASEMVDDDDDDDPRSSQSAFPIADLDVYLIENH